MFVFWLVCLFLFAFLLVCPASPAYWMINDIRSIYLSVCCPSVCLSVCTNTNKTWTEKKKSPTAETADGKIPQLELPQREMALASEEPPAGSPNDSTPRTGEPEGEMSSETPSKSQVRRCMQNAGMQAGSAIQGGQDPPPPLNAVGVKKLLVETLNNVSSKPHKVFFTTSQFGTPT